MKKILAALVVALLLTGTAIAFSYWDNLEQTQSETINISDGVTLVVAADATADPGESLVPTGVVLKAGDVTSITLTYNVKLDQAASSALNLSVSADNVLIGGDGTNASIVNIDITQAASTVNDTNVLVTVVVSINEPATEAIYTAIANKAISFDLTFTGTVA